MSQPFDDVGGSVGLGVVVDMLYSRVVADPLLSPWFEGVDLDRLRRHQVEFLSVVLGGPGPHRRTDLARAHHGLEVTGHAFERLLEHLDHCLAEVGLSAAHRSSIGETLDRERGRIVHQP